MGLLNYLGGRGSSGFGEGSSRHVESDVGGVTVGGVALEEEKSWEQPDPSVDNVPFTSFDEARASEDSRRRRASAADRDHENVVDALERDFDVTIPVEGRPLVPNSLHQTLLVWFVLVSLVRALALTVFEVVTDFNAERGNVENGKV